MRQLSKDLVNWSNFAIYVTVICLYICNHQGHINGHHRPRPVSYIHHIPGAGSATDGHRLVVVSKYYNRPTNLPPVIHDQGHYMSTLLNWSKLIFGRYEFPLVHRGVKYWTVSMTWHFVQLLEKLHVKLWERELICYEKCKIVELL